MTPQPSGAVCSPHSTGTHARPERTSTTFPPAPPPVYGLAVPATPAPAPAADEARAERRLYIAPYNDEAPCDVEVAFDVAGRVCYVDERPSDRCIDGWLWERWEGSQTGGQLWAGHHPGRQPDVMRHPPRCGGCAGKAHRDKHGMLWLLHATAQTPRTWPCDITTVTPPMCLDDARWALHNCRADGGFIAVRTRNVEIIGVRGTVYSPNQPPQADTLVLFHDSRMNQVVANRLVIRLHDAVLDETTLPLLSAGGPL
ncbi:hypothetical protein [Streptomyces rubradiris]|uniref:Uncharacterized protein n=1 Tax=Streptomyces rubradiris TaxID=285531 RepID=A0ABQ3RA45_STRRR|nr:hypothetical protein [Streptomyces rubradiris]GHH25792.1 hypothetical protein GCM10018792_65330 [Streptomyces rubradiris]GHI52738.1 hypothetical protein Srubr_25840 [Streptomyces rubradiris]